MATFFLWLILIKLCCSRGEGCANTHHHALKSIQVSTLPKAKSETRSKQNKDMHK